MHSYEALPQANQEYMKRQCAQRGASSLACRSLLEIVVVFLTNDVLALTLNHLCAASQGGARRCQACRSFDQLRSRDVKKGNWRTDGLKEIQVVLPEFRVGILFDPHDDVRTKPFSVGEFSGREALVAQSFRFTFKGEISMRNKVDASYNL